MNLGQLIGGLLLRLENAEEALVPPYKPRKPGAMPERIYNVLVACDRKVTWPEIVELCDIQPEERQRAAHALLDLLDYKHVQREGVRRKYKYSATRRA